MIKPIHRLVLFLLVSVACFGQEKHEVSLTEAFVVTGAVEKELTFRIADLAQLPSSPIADVVITNHLGEPRGTAKALKGVKIKDVLSGMVIKSESPKVLSEYFLTFIASDGYTVVYSWNELFNSPTGDNCFLITEKDGKKLSDIPDGLLVLTPTDFKTGRRHIKGLQQVIVSRTEIQKR
jgi:hypothetical protein